LHPPPFLPPFAALLDSRLLRFLLFFFVAYAVEAVLSHSAVEFDTLQKACSSTFKKKKVHQCLKRNRRQETPRQCPWIVTLLITHAHTACDALGALTHITTYIYREREREREREIAHLQNTFYYITTLLTSERCTRRATNMTQLTRMRMPKKKRTQLTRMRMPKKIKNHSSHSYRARTSARVTRPKKGKKN
jgi:hypothetical protein